MTVSVPTDVVLWLVGAPTAPFELRSLRMCCAGDRWVVELSEQREEPGASRTAVAIDVIFDSACEGALRRLEHV